VGPGEGRALRRAEHAYLAAREAHDRLTVARSAGRAWPELEIEAETAADEAATMLAALDRSTLDGEDLRAVAAMEHGLALIREGDAGASQGSAGLAAAYAETTERLLFHGRRVSRLAILGRLAREADAGRRRELFMALAPLWRTVDGDGGPSSPYRALVASSAARWAVGESPIAANAAALGLEPATIATWSEAILEAWADAIVDEVVEPWDWWWSNGELERSLARQLPIERLRPISDAYHAALGADIGVLGIVYDVEPRSDRPPVPLAETRFGGRPHRRRDGSWSTGSPTVIGTYAEGGLGELVELIHETGHAIHIAAIRTRAAFADWPDSDALTEAIADILASDATRPEWTERWIGPMAADGSRPGPAAIARASFSGIAMDAAWTLFEIRLHDDPGLRPNDVWTDLTERHLGIAGHTEWSWWAIRGQLVSDPGYMANYPIGAVLAAELRVAIRSARGDWTAGDPGWYAWVSEHLFRFGLERSSGDIVRGLIGRPPSPAALLGEISRPREG
jgi:hypothetical protein